MTALDRTSSKASEQCALKPKKRIGIGRRNLEHPEREGKRNEGRKEGQKAGRKDRETKG